LQGSAAADLWLGGRFNTTFLSSRSENTTVKELLKSVYICQSHCKNKSGTHFLRQCTCIRVSVSDVPKCAVYVLVRPAIPNCITEEVREALPSAVFTSNPCRLQYCTQEIVVFREDIVMKMCRNCVRYPADGNIPMHVILLAFLKCLCLCFSCGTDTIENMIVYKC